MTNNEQDPRIILDTILYESAKASIQLEQTIKHSLDKIIERSEANKGVLTILITSALYKYIHPNQDIKKHQSQIKNGYSGRTFDTKYVTPWLKMQNFPSMAESGWLTRSLEQPHPFDSNFPGKITPLELKKAFLFSLEKLESKESALNYLYYILSNLVLLRDKNRIDLAMPKGLFITEIIYCLNQHFTFRYHSEGAARLPQLAVYAAYKCFKNEIDRYKDKILLDLKKHTAADSQTGRFGDIDIVDNKDNLFESIEIKHNIKITTNHLAIAYEKFKTQQLDRYYLLSDCGIDDKEIDNIREKIIEIKKKQGCQVIVNGIIPTIKYYLRIIQNTDAYIKYYVQLLESDEELKYEHKNQWNLIINQ